MSTEGERDDTLDQVELGLAAVCAVQALGIVITNRSVAWTLSQTHSEEEGKGEKHCVWMGDLIHIDGRTKV